MRPRKDDVVIGATALSKSLTDMDASMMRGVLRSATTKAAAPIRKHMRSAVSPISKTMAKAIVTKVKVYKRSKTATSRWPSPWTSISD